MLSFFRIDLFTDPNMLERSTGRGAGGIARAIRRLQPYLTKRNIVRARQVACGKPFLPDPDSELELLPAGKSVSGWLKKVLSHEFGDSRGNISETALGDAMEAFVDGRLQTTKDPNSDWSVAGIPNGDPFFLFAEVAFYFIDNLIDALFWEQTLRPFVRTCEMFTELYWSGMSRSPGSYRTEFKGSRCFGEDRTRRLRAFFADRPYKQIERDFGGIVAAAFRDHVDRSDAI